MDIRDILITGWSSLLGDKKAYYVSGPITGGKRILDSKFTAQQAFDLNCKDILGLAGKLRTYDYLVLEPVPEWSQANYTKLWLEVVSRFISTVVLVDGWEYSEGCVMEYQKALTLNIPTLDSGKNPINPVMARIRIAQAIGKIRKFNPERADRMKECMMLTWEGEE